jgi:hypothetical protein
MNKKPVLYKTLIIGVIILFVGVGVQPAFAVDVSNNEDECNLCPKVSKKNIRGDMSPLCGIIGGRLFSLLFLDVIFTNLAEDLENSNPILSLISSSIATIYFIRVLIFGLIFSIFGCWDDWFDPYSISLL